MTRRHFIASVGGVAATTLLPRSGDAHPVKTSADTVWQDVREWGVEGKGWSDTRRYFDRLPAKAEQVVRPRVWELSRHSAGLCTRFETDASTLHVRYTLRSKNLGLPHMPPTGVSGLDLYAEDEQGRWRWASVLKPTARQMTAPLVEDLLPGTRKYMLYLPLYNGVDTLEIGIEKTAHFAPIPPRTEAPLVFYGTSITQGACASRPGMAYPALLGRRLNRPIINLGFSGNGEMDPGMADLLTELSPCAYVIDCIPNMEAQQISERAVPLVRKIRRAHADTPILLVEDRTYANAPFVPRLRRQNEARRAAFREVYGQLTAERTLHDAFSYLAPEGTLVVQGVNPPDTRFRGIEPRAVMHRQLKLTGGRHASRREVLEVLDLIAQGRLHTAVTQKVQLDRAEQLFDALTRGALLGRGVISYGA